MEDVCRKFPKICNCPYKNDIDNDLQKGKSPYYIAKWLKDTDCPISHETIRKYQKYLFEHDMIKQEQESPSHLEDDLLTELEKKTWKAIQNLDLESANPNVQVQFILGALKILVPNKQQVDVTANVKSEITTNLLDKIKLKRSELDDIRSD